MKLRSNNPFWLYHTPQLFSYPQLENDTQAEVVIIGAGISGALAAYALTSSGIRVILLEKNHAGMESTAASTSLLQYEIDTPLHELITKVGKEKAQRSYNLCYEALDELKGIHRFIGVNEIFQKRKSLQLASTIKDIQIIVDEYRSRYEAGYEVRLLNKQYLHSQFGFPHHAALYTMHGAVTDAYQLTQQLIDWAKNHGAKVYDRTEIKKIKSQKRKIQLITTDDLIVTAEYGIMATGYEAVKWIDQPIAQLHSTFAIASDPFPSRPLWKDDCMIWETSKPYIYLRTTNDNRVIIGGKDQMFHSTGKRDQEIKRRSEQLKKTFQKFFPHLKFNIDYAWAGTFANTKDGLPFIGIHKKYPRLFFALGFGGNGIVFSQVAATLIKNSILKKKNADLNIFSFNRRSL